MTGKNGIIGPICCQNAAKFYQRAKGLIVWISPISSSLYLIELQAAETRRSAM
jgi:hypothetical protein